MLDNETKRRIDNARDILVGKVPDPKSQVEQITIALIYKFMDDMDAESEALGGKRKFFAGEFARYGWPQLVRPGLSGHEVLSRYADAITRMPENPDIPPLFRNIFKNAYLPYRDPETLRAFLRIIDEFEYDHSERLGDAFEYLLSVLGAQGDAGQFRTPRHIIDFIVSIVAPEKSETILDPACGTAGFLISSYKYILRANTDKHGNNTLTPDERSRLADNLTGYDISPDMVRLSLVNMYLHDLRNPQIHEYDTLTSEDRWNEYADVILANPPFMSPRGGIRPHNRFSVQSNRSEVLFVDYIAEHLTPTGRAGIIVPEGIIFQRQRAYKQLRKMLVEEYLAAVISLPAGVFNPYTGVNTSILILDRALAKRADNIAFFKVGNDGYSLGAQRHPIDKNDLPKVQSEITEYIRRMRAGEPLADFQPMLGFVVEKERIIADGEYSLIGERYRESRVERSTYPLVSLGDICELVRGVTYKKTDETQEGGHEILRANNINKDTSTLDLLEIKRVSGLVLFSEEKLLRKNDILICLASGSKSHIGKVAFISRNTQYYFGGFMGAIRVNFDMVDSRYLFQQLRQKRFNDFLSKQIAGANIKNLGANLLYRFQVPLPPLEIQKEIVMEIENYQKVIDGARAVIENYKPHINVDPAWPLVKLGEFCEIRKGTAITRKEVLDGPIPVIAGGQRPSAFHNQSNRTGETITVSASGAYAGYASYFNEPIFASDCSTIKAKDERFINKFIFHALKFKQPELYKLQVGMGQPHVYSKDLSLFQIPIPPIEVQQEIVAEIEEEQALIAANQKLIERFERKIQTTIARIWNKDD